MMESVGRVPRTRHRPEYSGRLQFPSLGNHTLQGMVYVGGSFRTLMLPAQVQNRARRSRSIFKNINKQGGRRPPGGDAVDFCRVHEPWKPYLARYGLYRWKFPNLGKILSNRLRIQLRCVTKVVAPFGSLLFGNTKSTFAIASAVAL